MDVLQPQDAIVSLCQELVACVTKILDPLSAQADRSTCNQRVEDFKEQNPHCLQCGFRLAQEQDPIVRHFGLQLIEHFVKYRWNTLQDISRKEFNLQLLQYMSDSALLSNHEAIFVKESLARITVETAKRMWPQYWQSFFSDMNTLTQYGPTQVELVLLIFRRLTEDIHTFPEGLAPSRRREMVAGLTADVETVFAFLLQNLEAPTSDHLCPIALSAITRFVEWVEFNVLLMQECKLLLLLYTFISLEELKTASCECLLVILARKGDIKRTAKQRTKLLVLLSKDALDVILQASIKADTMGVEEEQYIFLKRVCQVLVHLGTSQLAPLWSQISGFTRPDMFELYLQVILEFTKHQSQLLCLTSVEVWQAFTTHNHIKEDPVFKNFLPNVLKVVQQRLMKLGDPTQNEHISSEYNRMDFDGVDEFNVFFSQYRSTMKKLVHDMALLMPRTAAKEALEVVQKLVQQQPESECTKNSTLYLEWEGFASYLECWTGTFKTDPDLKEVVREKCLVVLNHLLCYKSQDALLLGCQFRCLQSGLVFFLEYDQQVFQSYIQKVFSSIGFLGGATDKYRVRREVVGTRNLVATCLVHLCETHAMLLVPHLEQIHEQYQAMVTSDVLVYAEKCAFMEALLILSQLKHDVQQHTAFIGELLQEAKSLFQELVGAVASVGALIDYLWLNKDPNDPSYPFRRRATLCYITHVIVLILKRSQPLNTPEEPCTQSQTTTDPQHHPTYSHIVPFLFKFTLPLISSLYELWSGIAKPLLSNCFQSISDLYQAEKDAVMGRSVLRRKEEEVGELGQLQLNLNAIHEGCLQSIANGFRVYKGERLHDIGFVDASLQAVFTNAASLNSWRLRAVIRNLVIHLVNSCPETSWDTILIPFLTQMCCVTFTKLKASWDKITQKPSHVSNEEPSLVGEREVTQEVLEEKLIIALTREYANLLELVCCKKIKSGGKEKQGEHTAMEEEMEDSSCHPQRQEQEPQTSEQWSSSQTLTPLGIKLLQIQPMCELLFLSSFCALTWSDIHTVVKCSSVAGLIFEKTAIGSFSAGVYEQLFTQVLIGLQVHGMHDHIRNQLSFLALMIYQATVNQCPHLLNIVSQLPGTSPEKVVAFNDWLEKKNSSNKQKKEKFKELISGIFGKHIGETFKRPPVFFDLPEMGFKKMKPDGETTANLSALFQDSV